MSTLVPLLSRGQIRQLPPQAREVVEYRKSGLSLNHIQGCPLDCAYCIRHTYGLWDQRQPLAVMTDAEAVATLVGHPYFRPGVTPLQLLNRATEPFLPAVKPHTFAVLEDLDVRGLTNHVLVITRHQMQAGDCERLDRLRHLKVTLLFTYSGITDRRIEPYPSEVAAASLKLATARHPRPYRTVFYWRPLVPGINDSDEHLRQAAALSAHADATVFTGLFYRDQIAAYYRDHQLPEPYDATARRKVVPETLERRVLAAIAGRGPLFRKTSCAVSYAHGLADYNGHYGVRELCDICPLGQIDRCRRGHRVPSTEEIHTLAGGVPDTESMEVIEITERAAVVASLPHEQPRYFLQHQLGFQIHDVRHPHHAGRHGRADIGWQEAGAS
ncbi:radical SAM protein [Frankia sp. Cr2]|uniref:radical SAM protein n=1 Tax=Frankia sp. Cr2 TaxID=3073932 RepID=UPI002AD5A5A8|nr:radical SAM protein [Frankia sp. Cr2]